MKNILSLIKVLVPLLILVGAYVAASTMDHRDAKVAKFYYCSMVDAGHWPAYRDDIVCSKLEGE